MTMSRYAYDYSLAPVRPTGWRATLTTIMVVGTVMAVSAVSGVVVTLQLFASPAQDVAVPRVAAVAPVTPAPQPAAPRVVALTAKAASPPAPAVVATHHVEASATIAAAPTAAQVPPPASPVAAVKPAPVVAQAAPAPAPIADSDLTFAKGYAQRHAVATGTAAERHGKILVAAKMQLGRAAVKVKPRTYARNNANADRRRIETARGDAFGMFQRFERPDQFDFSRHQALAFGDQRATRRRAETSRSSGPVRNSPNGLFGGLF
jgi:hypothetical protein